MDHKSLYFIKFARHLYCLYLFIVLQYLTLAMRVPSYDGFDVVVLSADTVI